MSSTPHVPEAPRPRHDLTVAELDGEVVIYDEQHMRVHRLDPVATSVWQRLDGRATEVVVAELADVTGAPVERVGTDVARLLHELRDAGLLDGAPPSHLRDGPS